MQELTLIIPAKYETESLPKVLEEIKDYNLNIIIILEATDKETINAAKNYNCKIIHQSGKGYGNALIEGINNVETEYLCIFNADGSFDPKYLKDMLNICSNNEEFVFSSRYLKGAGTEDDTIITFIGNKIFSFLGKIFFSLPITDILYTFVLGNTEKVKNLELIKDDFSFCVELPIKAKKKGLKLTTNTAFERKRIGGKKKVNAFKDGSKILISMIALFLT